MRCGRLHAMRLRPLLAVAVLLATAVAVLGTGATTYAAPAGCTNGPKGFVMSCDQSVATARPRGAIGLIGDSVLLGSNNGMSTPGLPTMLAAKGWGPIRMTTVLGMRTRNDSTTPASAYHVLGRWKAAGFNPVVIVVNLGANHIGDCSPATVSVCKAKIDALLDRITALYPKATVWWAKALHETYGKGTGFSPGMLGWNAALDQAAKQRTNLIVWDWPKAVATSNPVIKMDQYNVHPISGAEYVKRSTLITNHLLTYVPARFAGPAAPLPAPTASGLEYSPLPAPVAAATTVLAAGAIRDINLSTMPALLPTAAAAALTVSVSGSAAAGAVTVYRCGAPPSVATLGFGAAQRRTAQAVVQLTARHVCIRSTVAVTVALGLVGSFVPPDASSLSLYVVTPYRRASPVSSLADRRITIAATIATASTKALTGTVTITAPTNGGYATVYRCGTAPSAVRILTFAKGETVSGAFFAPVLGAAVCVHVQAVAGTTFGVTLDTSGSLRIGGHGSRFSPVVSTRVLDTRDATRRGGWWGRHVARQVLTVPVAPKGALAVTGTATMVAPLTAGYLTAYRCNAARPNAVALNTGAKATSAALVTARVDTLGRVCLYSSANTNTLFDVSGWWVLGA